jgi:hypothetical protein
MHPNLLKMINTTRKGRLVALEFRSRNGGRVTLAMRRCLRGHDDILRVVESPNPGKVVVLTNISAYAEKGEPRTTFVAELNRIARSAA